MLVTKGRILAQRIFDVADEIDLARASGLVQSLSQRPRFVRSAQQIRLPHPPLEMSLGSRPSPFPELSQADVFVRVYDVGALAVTFALELQSPIEAEALVALGSRVMAESDVFIGPGRAIAEEISTAIRPACKVGRVSDVTEDYTVFRLHATDPQVDADSLADHIDLPRLLAGETGLLSRREREREVRATFSYGPEELIVIDWNSALIYDPSPSIDLEVLLEMTSMQLLELRAYDDIVGRSLAHVYDELEEERMFGKSRTYSRLSRDIMRLFADVTEMTDRIDNSLHILGDSWTAQVHRAAVLEFDIPRWQRLVNEKLEVLRQINEMLVNQITSSKSLRIEGLIVALIVVEILLALFKVI